MSRVKMAVCADCGTRLPERLTVRLHSMDWKHLCGDCMRTYDVRQPPILVRSCWEPWGELPVTPVGELLYSELAAQRNRRAQLKAAAAAARKGADAR